MKKEVITSAVFILLLSLPTIPNQQIACGNPTYIWDYPIDGGIVPPDNKTKPPTIQFHSENNTMHRNNSLSIPLHIRVGDSTTARSKYLQNIHYTIDWLSENTTLYEFKPTIYNSSNFEPPAPTITELSTTINLRDIPEGNHQLTVFAIENGAYLALREEQIADGFNHTLTYLYGFSITSSSTINFIVDTFAPKMTSFSIENTTYSSSELPLSLSTDDEHSHIQYSLDNGENITLTSNAKLSGLTSGVHTIAVYAIDSLGNVSNQTVTFTITDDSGNVVAVVAVTSALIVCFIASFLLFRWHRKNIESGVGRE